MNPIWKHIYLPVASAVSNLDSVEDLLRQTVSNLSKLYKTPCLLWAGLETDDVNALQVYGTIASLKTLVSELAIDSQQLTNQLEGISPLDGALQPWDTELTALSEAIVRFFPQRRPLWLTEQRVSPHLVQLETGEWIIPITSNGTWADLPLSPKNEATPSLQLVLQLGKLPSAQAAVDFQENLESFEIICTQIRLAYAALYWRQKLEQSRQQVALAGRIARLLNSSLNPDEIVGRIVAELGQGLECDRCILVDLRPDPVNVLAIWDRPDQHLVPLIQRQIDRDIWRNVVDILQGGASYLTVNVTEPDPDPIHQWLHEIGAASVVIIPLFIQSEFFGAVSLLSYRSRTYEIDELQTVRQVADQAAIALTNAQHYQRLWNRQEALRLQNSSLKQKVIQDELTQIMNRRSLERELEQLSAAAIWATQPAFSLIVCDIDYFKLINDTHGHLVGDEVLHILAQRLRKQLRQESEAYRYGGEEFVILLPATELKQAIDVAERLRQAVRSTSIQTSIGSVAVTASFGVAQQDSTCDHNAWDVLQRADRAMYEAKRQGRDRIQVL